MAKAVVKTMPAIIEVKPIQTFENTCKFLGGEFSEETGWFKEKKSVCEVEDDEDFITMARIMQKLMPQIPKENLEVRYKYFFEKRGEFSVYNEKDKAFMTAEMEGESSLTDEMMWSSVYEQINEERAQKGLRELEEEEIYEKVGDTIQEGVDKGFDAVRGTPEKIKEMKEVKRYLLMDDNLGCDIEEYDGTTYPKCSIGAVNVTAAPKMRVLDDMDDTLDIALRESSDNFYAEFNAAIEQAVKELPA